MKQISIRQPMIIAVDETDEGLSKFPNQMLKWAKYIEKAIGTPNAYKWKAKKYTITGNTIELPDDCYRPLKILPGDWEDECNAKYIETYNSIVKQDTIKDAGEYGRDLVIVWKPLESNWLPEENWTELKDTIEFIYNYTEKEFTLIYEYIETDPEGFWLINESHERAIADYIIYKYSKKLQWKLFKSSKLLRQGHIVTIRDLEHKYNISIRNARVEDLKESRWK